MQPTSLLTVPASDRSFLGLARRRLPERDPDRVRRCTPDEINRAIDRATDRSITRFAAQSDQRIRQRIAELDREWDVERVLELHAACLGLAGLALALQIQRKWLILPGVALGFLLQHSLQGWCPPLPVLRRLGVRTRGEIDREKYTLLHLLETGSVKL
jgi:hypothetical protein